MFGWQCCKMRLFEKLFKQCESKGSSNGVSTFFLVKSKSPKNTLEKSTFSESTTYNTLEFRGLQKFLGGYLPKARHIFPSCRIFIYFPKKDTC